MGARPQLRRSQLRSRYHPTSTQREPAMPPRTASKILAEWHELAMQREEATDSDIADGLAARIDQLRREYIEGTPPEEKPATLPTKDDDEPKVQMKLPL
jgi:hypothetical protein